MNKTLVAAVLLSAGVAGQVGAQNIDFPFGPSVQVTDPYFVMPTTKWGLLNVSLNNQFQAYQKGNQNWGIKINPPVPGYPNRTWTSDSYNYLNECLGTVTYLSDKKKVDNRSIIAALNAGLRRTKGGTAGPLNRAGSPFSGSWNVTKAKIVVVNYENKGGLPPYPPTRDAFDAEEVFEPSEFDGELLFTAANAPWNLAGIPDDMASDGTYIPLAWPNQNYISWGKPDDSSDYFNWMGARVFVIDTTNPNPLLRCFDVTPFFAFEEAYCKFCWDTLDRVTDGKITRDADIPSDAPCALNPDIQCGIKGSGTTKIYWTVKFSNIGSDQQLYPNLLLDRYYIGFLNNLGFEQDEVVYGTILDDTDINSSQTSLVFTVAGVATYKWSFKTLSDGLSWPIGSWSMSASGYGYSPLCGVFTGSVSMPEYDRSSKTFSNGGSCIE